MNTTCSIDEVPPCSGHGNCVNERCLCYPLFEGPRCSVNQIDITPGLWHFFWIHVYFFAALFVNVSVFSSLQFFSIVREKGWKNVPITTYSLFGLLFLVGLDRVVFLLLDPYRYRGLIGAVGESVIFGFAVSFLVGIYLLIIMMWIKMYKATQYMRSLKYALRSAWIAIGVVFGVEVVYDVVRGLFSVGPIRLITLSIYTVVLGVGILTVAILFLVYGRKIYNRLKKFENRDPSTKNNMKKINRFARAITITTIIFVIVLAIFLVLQIFFSQNPIIFMLLVTFQRCFELIYCGIIIANHWKTVKTSDAEKSNTRTPTTKDSQSHDEKHSGLSQQSNPDSFNQ
jgi:hypothetical protein